MRFPFNIGRFLMHHPLTRRRPWAAALRYARWQVGSRIVSGAVVVEFVNDARLLIRPGMTGATGNVYAGLHEFEDMSFLLHMLRAEDLFVDVGANVGTYTVLAAKASGAHAIAFEPVPSTLHALRDNIALNGIGSRVELRETCVGSGSGIVQMTTANDTTNHIVGNPRSLERTVAVPVETLDEALAQRAPTLIKIDVEGYELQVLRGATRTLSCASLHCVIMEVNGIDQHEVGAAHEVLTIMEGHGFSRYSYLPLERHLVASADSHSGPNVLFIRNLAIVQQRLTHATPFRVLDQEI